MDLLQIGEACGKSFRFVCAVNQEAGADGQVARDHFRAVVCPRGQDKDRIWHQQKQKPSGAQNSRRTRMIGSDPKYLRRTILIKQAACIRGLFLIMSDCIPAPAHGHPAYAPCQPFLHKPFAALGVHTDAHWIAGRRGIVAEDLPHLMKQATVEFRRYSDGSCAS